MEDYIKEIKKGKARKPTLILVFRNRRAYRNYGAKSPNKLEYFYFFFVYFLFLFFIFCTKLPNTE